MKHIEPCPWCQKKAISYRINESHEPDMWIVECSHRKCGASGPSMSQEKLAIKKWNYVGSVFNGKDD